MCWDADFSLDTLRSGTRRARNPRRCAEGCQIAAGDLYHYWVGLYEGEFWSNEWCVACNLASSVLGSACRLYDPHSADAPIGNLIEEFAEHLDRGELAANGVPARVIAGVEIQRVALLERLADS